MFNINDLQDKLKKAINNHSNHIFMLERQVLELQTTLNALAKKLNDTLDLGMGPVGGRTRIDMDLNIENVFAVEHHGYSPFVG